MSNLNFWQKLKAEKGSEPILVLAPMADVTDRAFRYIIAKYSKYGGQNIGVYGKLASTRARSSTRGGPDVLWTEFVSADGLFLGGRDALINDLSFTEAERPVVAQFFTSKPEMMEKAAKLAVELGFDGIDINMGCPDRSVEKQGAGASLIKNPELAKEIILAAKRGVKTSPKSDIGQNPMSDLGDSEEIPVSVKTRVGYNKNEMEEWLPKILETEPALVTIHARTRKELSLVPANWDYVKRAVEIRNEMKSETLIFGNGDVSSLEEAREKAKETGCDGVMIGRGIFGTPEFFSGKIFDTRKRLEVLIEHTKLFEKIVQPKPPIGQGKSFAVMKKHFKAYVNGFDGAKELRVKLMEVENAEEVEKIINKFLKENKF